MALKFNIKPTQDCGKLKYTNCSTYCSPDNYSYELLLPSIVPNFQLFGNRLNVTTDILTTHGLDATSGITWEVNGGSTITSLNVPTNTGLVSYTQQSLLLDPTIVNVITMTVTDSQANVADVTFALKYSSSGGASSITWYAIPDLNVTTGNTLEVAFNDASELFNAGIDLSTINFEPDGSTALSAVQNFTYSSAIAYTITYEFEEDQENTPLSYNAYINILEDDINCENQLTQSNIDSVVLTATSPKGTTYTLDITDNFTTLSTFDVLATSFGSISTFESGIWTFQTIVTKVTNTGTYIFAETIKVVIICKEECAFNAYVATYAEEEIDCCSDCKVEKEKKIILMQTYIDAIKNASACGELTKITKFINLLQRLLSNKNCNC